MRSSCEIKRADGQICIRFNFFLQKKNKSWQQAFSFSSASRTTQLQRRDQDRRNTGGPSVTATARTQVKVSDYVVRNTSTAYREKMKPQTRDI